MTTPPKFEHKEEAIVVVLRYYRGHSATVRGPLEATKKLWRRLRGRIPPAMMEAMAQAYLAHEVGHHATHGRMGDEAWRLAPGTLTQGTPIKVRIHQVPSTGPQVLYPRILVQTMYATKTVVKPLIKFTADDLHYVIEGFGEQRDGLDRRIGALHCGLSLLTQEQVTTIAELPTDALKTFAAAWEDALEPPRGTAVA